jgi:hypothetical protein
VDLAGVQGVRRAHIEALRHILSPSDAARETVIDPFWLSKEAAADECRPMLLRCADRRKQRFTAGILRGGELFGVGDPIFLGKWAELPVITTVTGRRGALESRCWSMTVKL